MSDFQHLSKRIIDISKVLNSQIEKILEPMKKVNEAYSDIIRATTKIEFDFQKFFNFDSFKESMDRIAKGIIETEKDLKLFKAIIVDLGYPPDENMSIRAIRAIAQAHREDRKALLENIDDFMCDYYNSQLLTEIANNWETNCLLKKRIAILRNVIMSHNQGMYNVSIPATLAQLEGVIIDTFDIRGRVDGKIINILLKRLLKNRSDKYSFDDQILSFYRKNILSGFEHGKEVGSEISRHAILHGGDTDYGKQSNSIKTILLFDYIVTTAKSLDFDSIELGQADVRQYRESRR